MSINNDSAFIHHSLNFLYQTSSCFTSDWTGDWEPWPCSSHAAVPLPILCDSNVRQAVLPGRHRGWLLFGGGCMGSRRRGEGDSNVLFKWFFCLSMCKLISYSLSLNAQIFELPADAGIPIGGGDSDNLYRLEIHYNNPAKESGKYCRSYINSISWLKPPCIQQYIV